MSGSDRGGGQMWQNVKKSNIAFNLLQSCIKSQYFLIQRRPGWWGESWMKWITWQRLPTVWRNNEVINEITEEGRDRPVIQRKTCNNSGLHRISVALQIRGKNSDDDDDMSTWHAMKKIILNVVPFFWSLFFWYTQLVAFLARVEILIRGPPFEVFPSHALGIISDSSTCGKYRQFQWFYQRSLDPPLAKPGSHVLSPACWRRSWGIAARYRALSCRHSGIDC